jgi:glycosyltransferase involved in cell wall biosynthesis
VPDAGLRILFLAPCPFYQDRGTPIAIRELLRVLSGEGHRVDVLCYHEGAPVDLANVTLHRIPATSWVRNVPPGPSWKKIVCDLRMAPAAFRLARERRYDVVHAVEEAAAMALALKRRLGLRYVYDMDSAMPRQIADKLPLLGFMRRPMEAGETALIRASDGVLAMCEALADRARAVPGERPVAVVEDPNLADFGEVDPGALREQCGGAGRLLTYVGNLEPYQGIDLLLRGFARAAPRVPDADLLVVGGRDDHIAHYRGLAARLGVEGRVHFLGPQPVARLGFFLGSSDALVSPRIHGENTPMKVYSYMASGRPVIATAIASHTQVLDDRLAVLVAPEEEAVAEGIVRVLNGPGAAALGARAREVAEARYSMKAFTGRVAGFYREMAARLGARAA